jgi:anti-sigma regulatory factor (Ser/Thr protein kinase)
VTDGRRVEAAFGREATEVARARQVVGSALAAWGLDAERTAIELAVSELVSNAITHGAGDVRVCMDLAGDHVHLEVSDEGGGRPVMSPEAPVAGQVGGWGLRFVDELADDWGADTAAGLTRVWMDKRTGGAMVHNGDLGLPGPGA